MNEIVYEICLRHSLGEFKNIRQRDRYFLGQCVYCGAPRPANLLGPACEKTECKGKRWADLKLTERQMIVFRGIYDGKRYTEIAREMNISPDRVKEHSRAIARRLDIDYNHALLVRCYIEWQAHRPPQTAGPSPQRRPPLRSTPRKRTIRK
jgi:DNA-binding CsgD family transcriptional regulator